MSDETQDRHTVLSEAYDKLAAGPVPEVESVEPVEAAPEVEASEAVPEAKPGQPRLPDGKFAKVEKAAEAPKAAKSDPVAAKPDAPVPAPAPEAAPVPEAPSVKAPQSWKPAAREAFSKAPPEVQQEVARREAEITRTLQEVAPVRQYAQAVQQSLQPYEGIARASGMDAMTWAGQALQTFAGLHQGTPQHKAAIVAQAIRAFGIDVEAVNAAMQGQPVPQGQPQAPQQDVGQLVEQALQQRVQAAQQARAAQAWQEFQASAPEFLDAVKGDMQELLDLAGRQGRNMTYQQAYDRAVKLNEEVSGILAQRKAAEAAKAQAASTQRVRAAASSVKAVPAAATSAQPADRRELLSRRYDELSE